MPAGRLEVPFDRIADICGSYPVRKLSVLGSVLRDDFASTSDIDLLVEFEAGALVSHFDLAAMETEISDLLRRRVDLNTAGTSGTRCWRKQR